MQPIGLTLKNFSDELMIVHRCVGCGKLSCNRIAGDDYPDAILQLLDHASSSTHLKLLSSADRSLVLTALYGDHVQSI